MKISKKIKITFFSIIFITMFISLISASPSFYFKERTNIDLKVGCVDSINEACPSNSNCFISINYPNSRNLIDNQLMNQSTSLYIFSYSLNETQTTPVGEYSVYVYCSINNGKEFSFTTFTYEVTPTGDVLDLKDVFTYFFILLFILMIFILSIKMVNSNPPSEDPGIDYKLYQLKKKNEFIYYLKVIKSKLYIVGVFGVYLSILLFFVLLNELVFTLGFNSFNEIIKYTIILLSWGLIPFVLFWIGYIIIVFYKTTERIMRYQFGGFKNERN